MIVDLTPQQIDAFHKHGFVVVENVLEPAVIDRARSRFAPMFAGEFETGLQPDEWNWRAGASSPDVTRQICNGWKADQTVCSIVLRQDIGRACAQLRGWPGARLNEDNVIWRPPGTKAPRFHQDDAYQDWIVPNEMVAFWITLDDTKADQGTVDYVDGSHLWPLSPPISNFHAPDNPIAYMMRAAEHAGVGKLDIVPIEVPAEHAVIHHGRTWHGSRDNRGAKPRRSIVAHCMSSHACFHEQNTSAIYSRYKRRESLEMDESFFPILWRKDGYRSPWLT